MWNGISLTNFGTKILKLNQVFRFSKMLQNPQIINYQHELKAFFHLLALSVKIGSIPSLYFLDVATLQALTLNSF